jgi:uncharacterized protein (TIGR02466 family)
MAAVQVSTIFPTQLVVKEYATPVKLNEALMAYIGAMRVVDPAGIYRSNVAGTWHSKDTVLTDCGPAGRQLAKMFNDNFAQLAVAHGGGPDAQYAFKMQAWAMAYTDGGYATVHTHPNCHFAGVYYVSGTDEEADLTMATGVKAAPGTLEFVDQRGINAAIPGLVMQPGARLRPKVGSMVVFPSWLPHFVHPVKGEGTRVSIACNATLVDTKKEKK